MTYYFSDRGAYRWDNVSRTDIALNYSFFLNLGGTQLELFLQPDRSGIRDIQIVDLFYVLRVLLGPYKWWTPEDILAMTTGPCRSSRCTAWSSSPGNLSARRGKRTTTPSPGIAPLA